MFRSVTFAAIVVGMYTGMKAAYLLDRSPRASRGTSSTSRRCSIGNGHRPRASARQSLGARRTRSTRHYPGDQTPFQMGVRLYLTRSASDPAAGEPLPLLDADHRAVGAARRPRHRSVGLVALPAPATRVACGRRAVLAVGILGWNLTGEISAAAGTNSISCHGGAHASPSLHVG
jgi:hypothetical protein